MGIPMVMWVAFTWIVGLVLTGAFSLLFDQFSTVNTLMQFDVFKTQSISMFGATVNAPWPNIEWLSAVGDLTTFNYPYLTGDMNMVRVVVFGALIIAFVWGMIKDFGSLLVQMLGVLLQGIGAVAQGIGGAVASVVRFLPGL